MFFLKCPFLWWWRLITFRAFWEVIRSNSSLLHRLSFLGLRFFVPLFSRVSFCSSSRPWVCSSRPGTDLWGLRLQVRVSTPDLSLLHRGQCSSLVRNPQIGFGRRGSQTQHLKSLPLSCQRNAFGRQVLLPASAPGNNLNCAITVRILSPGLT